MRTRIAALQKLPLGGPRAPAALSDSHGLLRRLGYSQPDIGDSNPSGLSPMHDALCRHPAQPSTFGLSRGGPPITQRTSGLVRCLIFEVPPNSSLPQVERCSPVSSSLDSRLRLD